MTPHTKHIIPPCVAPRRITIRAASRHGPCAAVVEDSGAPRTEDSMRWYHYVAYFFGARSSRTLCRTSPKACRGAFQSPFASPPRKVASRHHGRWKRSTHAAAAWHRGAKWRPPHPRHGRVEQAAEQAVPVPARRARSGREFSITEGSTDCVVNASNETAAKRAHRSHRLRRTRSRSLRALRATAARGVWIKLSATVLACASSPSAP